MEIYVNTGDVAVWLDRRSVHKLATQCDEI
jgi:hypothetical protein